MKLRILTTFLVVAALSAWVAACSPQARPVCLAGHGYYASKWTLKSGQPTGECSTMKGELLGVEKFNAPATPDDQTIWIQTSTMLAESTSHTPGQSDRTVMSNGKLLKGDPDADNLCIAPTLSEASNADGSRKVSWSNVKFFVTALIPGTQFTGDVKYTAGGCTAEYSATALFPAIPCETDADCGDKSGINPDFAVKCDTSFVNDYFGSSLCVLAKDTVPSLEDGKTP